MRVLLVSEDAKFIEQITNLLSAKFDTIVLTSMPQEFIPNFSAEMINSYNFMIWDIQNHKDILNFNLKTLSNILFIVEKETMDSDLVKFLNIGNSNINFLDLNEDFDEKLVSLMRLQEQNSHTILGLELKIPTDSNEIEFNGKTVKLTRTEYEILKYLQANVNKVISRDKILDSVWNQRSENVMSNTIDVHMNSIRNKMKKIGATMHIETIHGFGYKLSIANVHS